MRPEDKVQATIIDFLRVAVKGCLPFAIPNASARTWSGQASNAVPGIVPGMPDLGVVFPNGVTGFIEVKADKGTVRKNQEAVGVRLVELGAPYAVARSIEDVRAALKDWGVETREARQ